LAALPARAAVRLRVLTDDLACDRAAARAGTELDPLWPELLLVERRDLVDGLLREVGDPLHERRAVAAAVLDLRELVLPVAGEFRRGELVLLEHRDHLDALGRRLQVLADALDVLAPDEDLDRLRACRRRPETGVLHRLARLLVVDQLAGGLHRGEQRRLGVAGRRLRHLGLDLACDAAHGLALRPPRGPAACPLPRLRL